MAQLSPLEGPVSRTDQVLAVVRTALLAGDFKPGERITEGEIANQLGVSKTPVREALSMLRSSGLVKAHQARGFVVAHIDADVVRELYSVRALIEPWAVTQAVPNNGPEIAAAGRELLASAEKFGRRNDYGSLSQLNRDFHELLYQECGNELLKRILRDMRDHLQFVAASGWRTKSTWDLELAEHLAILDAVEQGDPDVAGQRTLEHIEGAKARLMEAANNALIKGSGFGVDEMVIGNVGERDHAKGRNSPSQDHRRHAKPGGRRPAR